MEVHFEGKPTVGIHGTIEQPSQELIKNTPSLWQADLDTAIRYGGELTRAALGAMDFIDDKKYIVVDTKVHMLMPGQCPAIPGWHTDGAPRRMPATSGAGYFTPLGEGPPNLQVQKNWEKINDTPRFHLLVTGEGCLTDFLDHEIVMYLPESPTSDLYSIITQRVKSGIVLTKTGDMPFIWESPSCTAISWGWWHLHAAKIATKREFRFLIRVTESNYHEPLPPSRLPDIIRTQQMVYSPMEFGW